jgi:hypothetical protein
LIERHDGPARQPSNQLQREASGPAPDVEGTLVTAELDAGEDVPTPFELRLGQTMV